MITIHKTLNLFGSENHLGQVNFDSLERKNYSNSDLSKALKRKKTAIKKLCITASVFTLLFLLNIPTDFLKSVHKREVELLCEFQNFDVQPRFDIKRNKDESVINQYFANDEFEIAVDYGIINFKSLSYSDIILLANSYQKLGRIDKAIIVYEKLINVKSERFREFVEYKLAYLYLSSCNVKGFEYLHQIMSKENHFYNDLAFRLNNYNPTILLSSELKKNKLLESFTIE